MGVDICSSFDKKIHHLNVAIVSSYNQGSDFILSDNTNNDHFIINIYTSLTSLSGYIIFGFDICPIIQEELHDREMVLLSGCIQCGRSILEIE